ncbi:OLC1v1009217C1 [Oldenlandia corymbosa var. corymbosa]|uniref:OLC1v1009217C1 n=1 Tax=Oldenlandia corymbosa var. corymbosa TaxID=529605 RepID=A0AAV1DNZ2_OLDCO|nr:OLC1v1009217C1 [Oldenlandia corymbosa var. corymbosa]
MDGDKVSGEYKKNRVVLGDVTNQLGKRPFSSISKNVGVQSEEKNGENFNKKELENVGTKVVHADDADRSKRVCLVPPPGNDSSSAKENAVLGVPSIPDENKEPQLLASGPGSSMKEKAVLGVPSISNEIKDSKLDSGLCSSDIRAIVQEVDDSRSSCEDAISMPTCKSDDDCVEVICDSERGRVGSHSDGTHVSENESDDHGVDNFVSSQTGSVDGARFPDSQESKTFGVERCSGPKADGCSNLATNIDLIRSCACSFCTKAGYVWLDLHYQDMKGRLGALKKIQKDASSLVERSFRAKGTDIHAPGSSHPSTNLENDLMVQWRSLFLRMGGIFEREGNQLVSSISFFS